MSKKSTRHDQLKNVDFITLSNAKQGKIELNYNFLGRVLRLLINRVRYKYFVFCVTKSINKEGMKTEAKNVQSIWVQTKCENKDFQPDDVLFFLTRVCCDINKTIDSKTPGFFKVIWTRRKVICLNK